MRSRCERVLLRARQPKFSLARNYGRRDGDLLQAMVRYVAVNHNAEHFVEELNRFVVKNPGRFSAILASVLNTHHRSSTMRWIEVVADSACGERPKGGRPEVR
jgi:hypothetical protein